MIPGMLDIINWLIIQFASEGLAVSTIRHTTKVWNIPAVLTYRRYSPCLTSSAPARRRLGISTVGSWTWYNMSEISKQNV